MAADSQGDQIFMQDCYLLRVFAKFLVNLGLSVENDLYVS